MVVNTQPRTNALKLVDTLIVRLPPCAGQNGTLPQGPLSFIRVARNKVIQRGRALIGELPRVRDIVLLLPAEDVLVVEREVPPLSERKLRAALPGLIEDATFADLASLHVAAAAPKDGKRLLAVLDKALLRAWVDLFQKHGLRVNHAWCEGLAMPYDGRAWSMTLRRDASLPGAVLRCARDSVITLSGASASDAAILEHSIQFHKAPAEVVEYGEPSALASYEGLFDQIQVSPRRGMTDALTAYVEADVSEPALDLMQGEFAQSFDASELRAFTTIVALCLIALLVQTFGVAFRSAQLANEKTELIAQQGEILKRAFPETTTILDAPVQMRRALGTLEQHAGQSSAQGFEALLAEAGTLLGSLPPNSCTEMHFENNTLSMHLKGAGLSNAASPVNLVHAALSAGYTAAFETGSDGDMTLRLSPKAGAS